MHKPCATGKKSETTDRLYIESPYIQNATCEVLNVWGQKVARIEMAKGKGEIKIANWAEGIYFYRIFTNKTEVIWKICGAALLVVLCLLVCKAVLL